MLSRAQRTSAPPCHHPPLHPLSAIWAIYRDRGVQAGCFFGALTPRWYLGPNGIGGAIARSFFYWPSPPCSVWLISVNFAQRDSKEHRLLMLAASSLEEQQEWVEAFKLSVKPPEDAKVLSPLL